MPKHPNQNDTPQHQSKTTKLFSATGKNEKSLKEIKRI